MTEQNTHAREAAKADDDPTAATPGDVGDADQVAPDDEHKTEKLTKAGRDIDPNEGAD